MGQPQNLEEYTGMKILLGGIPLGCDNIGDEAIINCVIKIVRSLEPSAEIAVATGTIEFYNEHLQVKGVPLYGFDPAYSLQDFDHEVRKYDLYIWAGATGLSDYPDLACDLLSIAQKNQVRTVIWNVGMNNTFNPAFFKLGGRKRRLCDALKFLIPNLAERWENILIKRIRDKIANVAGNCDFICLRDADSLEALRLCAPFRQAQVGADSALLQEAASPEDLPWASTLDRQRFEGAKLKIALCISAQTPINDHQSFANWLDRILEEIPDLLIVALPMNPLTDHDLMLKIKALMKHQDGFLSLNFPPPEQVQYLVGECSLVISSRLHLIILGLNKQVPAIGIERGSKVATFLAPFQLKCCGSTGQIDYEALTIQTKALLNDQNEFRMRAKKVRNEMLERLEKVKKELSKLLVQLSLK